MRAASKCPHGRGTDDGSTTHRVAMSGGSIGGRTKQRLTSEGEFDTGLKVVGDGNTLLQPSRRLVRRAAGRRPLAPDCALCQRMGGREHVPTSLLHAVHCPAGGRDPIRPFTLSTRRPVRIAFWARVKFASNGLFGLAVSPDGGVILYDRLLREGHDLMLIENFNGFTMRTPSSSAPRILPLRRLRAGPALGRADVEQPPADPS